MVPENASCTRAPHTSSLFANKTSASTIQRPTSRVWREVGTGFVFRRHYASFREIGFSTLTPLCDLPALIDRAAAHLSVVSAMLADFRAAKLTHGASPPFLRLSSSLGSHRNRCHDFPIAAPSPCIQQQCMALHPTLLLEASSSPSVYCIPCRVFSDGLNLRVVYALRSYQT